jgi:hypothetical protein
MAALEASVAAAKAARGSAAPETITAAASRGRKAAKRSAAAAEVESEVEVVPARRRKSA